MNFLWKSKFSSKGAQHNECRGREKRGEVIVGWTFLCVLGKSLTVKKNPKTWRQTSALPGCPHVVEVLGCRASAEPSADKEKCRVQLKDEGQGLVGLWELVTHCAGL